MTATETEPIMTATETEPIMTADSMTASALITDDIRQAAHEMYVQTCGAAQAEAHPYGVDSLVCVMVRRTVTALTEVKVNSPEHNMLSRDKNSVYVSRYSRYITYAHCLPAAPAPAVRTAAVSTAQSAQARSKAALTETVITETIIRPLFHADMAYSVGDVVDGKTIVAIKTTGADESNDEFDALQHCTVRPATDGEIVAYNAAQQQRLGEIKAGAARESAHYAGYAF